MIITSNESNLKNVDKIIILIHNWKVDFRIHSKVKPEFDYFWPMYKNMNKFKLLIDKMDNVTLRDTLEIDYILTMDNFYCAENNSCSHVFATPLALIFMYKYISAIECDLNRKIFYSSSSLVFFLNAYYRNLIRLMNVNYLKQIIRSSLDSKKVLSKEGEYFSFETSLRDIFEIEIYINKDNYVNLSLDEIMSYLNFEKITNANNFNQITN